MQEQMGLDQETLAQIMADNQIRSYGVCLGADHGRQSDPLLWGVQLPADPAIPALPEPGADPGGCQERHCVCLSLLHWGAPRCQCLQICHGAGLPCGGAPDPEPGVPDPGGCQERHCVCLSLLHWGAPRCQCLQICHGAGLPCGGAPDPEPGVPRSGASLRRGVCRLCGCVGAAGASLRDRGGAGGRRGERTGDPPGIRQLFRDRGDRHRLPADI